jgi:hypothetical protein
MSKGGSQAAASEPRSSSSSPYNSPQSLRVCFVQGSVRELTVAQSPVSLSLNFRLCNFGLARSEIGPSKKKMWWGFSIEERGEDTLHAGENRAGQTSEQGPLTS